VPERLAIDGGTPVRQRLLPYGRQTVDADDEQAVLAVLRSDFLTTGPRVAAFEEAFAAVTGAAHAVAFSNGTAALHGAAHVAGLHAGDEAITTPITFVATANCVRYEGATAVLADVRPDTLNIDPAQIRKAITSRTRAILPVDYTGAPADLDECLAIARERGLLVIEDAAHSLGATYKGRKVGAIADLTTFSFHPVKHVTTAEGGMVTTNDGELAMQLRRFRNHGMTTDVAARQASGSWFYDIVETGMNYRLTDLQCALGLSQLTKLPAWLGRRREIAARYDRAFAGVAEVETPVVPADRESAWHLYVLRFDLAALRVDRAAIFAALRAENIGVNVHYIPVHLHTAYGGPGSRGRFPVAEGAYDRMITLPIWPGMQDGDVDDVVTAVRRVVDAYRR
jgi:UDP-4-amino-4,6-dideoxy-N-acetyl-beta-L-altrosamine transaminase